MHTNKTKKRQVVWLNKADFLKDFTPVAMDLYKAGALRFAKLPKDVKYHYVNEKRTQAYNVGNYVVRLALQLWHPLAWPVVASAFWHVTESACKTWWRELKKELHDARYLPAMVQRPLQMDKTPKPCEK